MRPIRLAAIRTPTRLGRLRRPGLTSEDGPTSLPHSHHHTAWAVKAKNGAATSNPTIGYWNVESSVPRRKGPSAPKETVLTGTWGLRNGNSRLTVNGATR